MNEVGKLLKCDRCGGTVFLKEIEEKVQDGGYTRTKQYEDTPEGWEWDSRERKDLCPGCAEIFNRTFDNFYGREVK